MQAVSSSRVQAACAAGVTAAATRDRLLTRQLTVPRRSTSEARRRRVVVGAAHAALVAADADAAAAAAGAAPGTAPILALVLPREPIFERVAARLYEGLEGSVDEHLITIQGWG